MELIENIKEYFTYDKGTVIWNATACLIAGISLIISFYLAGTQFKDRLLRKKVLGYIYSFYQPVYIVDNLPSTFKIKKDIKCLLFNEQDVFDTLIELNKENLIEAVSDAETDLLNVKWKPNMNFAKLG